MALPVIFSGVSRRRVGLPMTVQSFASFRVTLVGAGSFDASSASAP